MRIFRRKRFEADMDAELRGHLDAYAADLVRSGLSRAEAERRARVEFGPLEAAKDRCRETRGLQRFDDLRADLRLTWRTLRRTPGFAAVAILSLALGIGANTAIFGLVDAVVLRLLPVRDPGHLVFIENVGTGGANGGPPYPCFELLRDHTTSFDGMAAFSPSAFEMTADRGREQVHGLWVSGNFYELLGVRPLRGRTLRASDDQIVGAGGPDGPVAVIGDAFWRQRFQGDPDIIGRHVMFFGKSFAIVGVMPSDAMSLTPGIAVDVALPMAHSDPDTLKNHGAWWLDIVARLKPGVAVERARGESNAIFQSFMTDVAISTGARKEYLDHIELESAAQGQDNLRKRFSAPLMALLLLAGLALLAACINVANLMLAQAANRRREFALRLAIGAGRGRLIRQTLTEAAVLVSMGALLGVWIAHAGEAALASFFSEGNDKIVVDLAVDGRVLLYTVAVSVLTGLAFGLLPALRASRIDPACGLKSGLRVAGTRGGMRLGRALVAAQVALAMVLVAGAGLFVHSLRAIESIDLGFTRAGILTMEVAPERDWFGTPEWSAAQREILDRVQPIPGVRSASWSSFSPLSGRNRGVLLDSDPPSSRDQSQRHAQMVSVSPEYFETFGVRALNGRLFTARDDGAAPKVAILNQTAARILFEGVNPVHRRLVFPKIKGSPVYEIVGVVNDARHEGLREMPGSFVYLPIPQAIDRINRLALAVRTSGGDPLSLAGAVRREVQSAHSSLLITNISTMEQQIARNLLRERLLSSLSVAFGLLALALTCIGLYGIQSYSVARRTNEIGLRLALGASRAETVWMVLREALFLAGAGVAIGTPFVWLLGRASQTLLYGVTAFDPLAVGASATGLLVFAVAAGWIPARRASRLEPLVALRVD